jgi:hypothetical protein
MAGYSGTPLAKKLGIKPGTTVSVRGELAHYERLVSPVPAGVQLSARLGTTTDIAHIFVTRRAQLAKALRDALQKLRPDAAIWVSWPKKASKVPTDITEDTIRAVALPLGLVDIKVCAVDETWSGLKLVLRKRK